MFKNEVEDDVHEEEERQKLMAKYIEKELNQEEKIRLVASLTILLFIVLFTRNSHKNLD
jgi:hypothetical protein